MTPSQITPTPQQAARLNSFESGFVQQCTPLTYRAIVNRIVCDVTIGAVVYNDLVVCGCDDVQLMWIDDRGRKTVYRLCALHGLVYNGHLERQRKSTTYQDNQRRGNSRRGWSEAR